MNADLNKPIEEMTEEELCKAHSYWWGQAMYHACAEGHAYFSESAALSQANRNCDKIEKIFKERGIECGWRSVEENGRKRDRHAYTKKGKDILVD